MIYSKPLYAFVALGVTWVSGFTSKKTMSPITADIVTDITAKVPQGSMKFPVESNSGFAIGDIVQIESTGNKELGQIRAFGSILVECPSKYAHTAGGTITVLPAGTFYEGCKATTEAPSMSPTTAPSVNPTEAPSASPSEAPSASPSEAPSASPSEAPTEAPTASPTVEPCPNLCNACDTDTYPNGVGELSTPCCDLCQDTTQDDPVYCTDCCQGTTQDD